jgi:hypothetical protein
VARFLSQDEASIVAVRILGARSNVVTREPKGFAFETDGFRDGRLCPLEGARDLRCGSFAFSPSRVFVFGQVLSGAISGHLGQNLLVRVEMLSDEATVAFGTLHGVLVFSGPTVDPGDHPAFAWYPGRDAHALSVDLLDVDRDGTLDVIYTYSQRLPGGRRVVARDVWTFVGLKAEKLISSGEKLSGVGTSTFDGVPLHEDGPDMAVRGQFRFEPMVPGKPLAGVFERARLAGMGSGWDLRLIADLGDGWREVLAGTGPQENEDSETAAESSCHPADVPVDADVGVRRRLLDIETACRAVLIAFSDARTPPWRAPLRLWVSLGLSAVGLPMAALSLRERVANDIAAISPRAWLVAAILSVSAALPADCALADALGPGSAARRWDALDAFQVLWPLTQPVNWMLRLLWILESWLMPN